MKSEKSIMLMTENGNQLTEYGIMLTAFSTKYSCDRSENPMTGCQANCFPYHNKISAAGEMLYFSLLHLYGTNDAVRKSVIILFSVFRPLTSVSR